MTANELRIKHQNERLRKRRKRLQRVLYLTTIIMLVWGMISGYNDLKQNPEKAKHIAKYKLYR